MSTTEITPKCPQCQGPLVKMLIGTDDTRDESGEVWSCNSCEACFEYDEL